VGMDWKSLKRSRFLNRSILRLGHCHDCWKPLLQSLMSSKPKCFCGNDARPSRSNTYCSRVCALVDAHYALGGSSCHYRNVHSEKVPIFEQKYSQIRALPTVDYGVKYPATVHDDPVDHGLGDHRPVACDALVLSEPLDKTRFIVLCPPNPRPAVSLGLPLLRKLFKVGI